MALQQWDLFESMSVLKDFAGTTTTTIRNVPETGQRGAADGCKDVQTATGNRSAAAAVNDSADGNAQQQQQQQQQQRPTNSGNNGWQSAEDPQRSASKKRQAAAAAANDLANAFPAPANGVERRVTKKINNAKENCNDDRRGEDESQQFLLSLLPYLRDVPKHRKLMVRHKLQKVFIDELEKHGDQHVASKADQLPPPPPPPPAARGPPPPYPHKYEFGGYVPPQRASAAAGKPPGAVDCPPKPHAYGKHTQRVSPQPAAGKCACDVPLLNVDYSTSMNPTVYYNGKAFAAAHVDFPAAHDMLYYGRNHYATSAAANVRAADATPTSANAGFSDPYTTAAVNANLADATGDNNLWTYCNI